MEVSKDVLRGRYNTFSDQSLLAASAAGPGPFSPVAWEVIQELLAARGLQAPRAPAPPPSAAPVRSPSPPAASAPARTTPAKPSKAVPARPLAVMPSPAPAESPYLLLAQLRGAPWPAGQALPTAARDILALAAFTFGVAGVALLGAAVALRGPRALLEPGSPQLVAATALSLVFGISTRRPPSLITWNIALVYGAIAPVLALAPVGSTGAPLWPRIVLGGVIGGCWVVYFLRRRGSYEGATASGKRAIAVSGRR